jgi:gluconolactonase
MKKPICAIATVFVTGCGGPGTDLSEAGSGDAGTQAGMSDAADDGRDANASDTGPGLDGSTPERDGPGGPGSDAGGDDANAPESDQNATPPAEGGGPSWSCPPGPFGNPMVSGAIPQRVAAVPPSDVFNNDNGAFGIVEGPAWLGDALYVSEIGAGPNPPPSRILKVTPAGMVTIAVADSGTNGLAVDKKGRLYGAVHKDGSVSRFDLATGMASAIASSYMGARFNSPNDLAVRSDGNIYFSDPSYQAVTPNPQAQTRAYRLAPGATAATPFDSTLTQPNGVTLSLDETGLYVASVGGIFKYALMADGSVGSRTAFAPTLNGDGMVIDCAGNLYVAQVSSGNVVVLSPSGAQLGQISIPSGMVGAVTNTAFGGADHKTLYITALGSGTQKGLFEVALPIPGMPY